MLRSHARRLALSALLFPSAAVAQSPSDSLASQVDRIFAPFTAAGSPGCLVGIARGGETLLAKGYGLANLEYEIPLTAQSISESGSVAKQFTAAAVALLHLDGKLSLDDDVRTHLPELHDFGARITVRHLLTHTSGLRDQWALLGLMGRAPGAEVHTMAQILDLAVRQRELNFPPGSEYLYSNLGYVLAAHIVQRVSGMPFAQFTRERLFTPLGMTETQWRDDYRRIVPRRATAYSRGAGGWIQDMPFTMVHGNGGLLSTLADLLKWNQSLTDGLLGRPELTRLLESAPLLTDGRQMEYALGLRSVPHAPGVREVSHSGATAGYRTWMARYPEANTAVAVFCNAGTANAGALGERVAALLIPRDAPPRATPTPVAAAERERLSGTYRNPQTDEWLTIAAVGDYLRVIGPSADSLRRLDDGRYGTAGGHVMTFAPAGGKVATLRLTESDGSERTMLVVTSPSARPEGWQEYAGSYGSPELGVAWTIAVENGTLAARISPDVRLPLLPFYEDGFRAGGQGTLRFVRGADGRITGLRAFAGRARNVRFERCTPGPTGCVPIG